MSQQELINYLNGDSQADQARAYLAAQGPTIIPQLLEALLEVLKALGRYAATQANSFDAENKIDLAAGRAWQLIAAVASVSPQNSVAAADRLIQSIRSSNPDIRALAIQLGTAEGIESETYLRTVAHCFVNDSAYLPKLAAAIFLAGSTDGSDNLTQAARGIASDWITGYAVPKYRFLVQKSAQIEDEWAGKMVIGIGAVYREIARS
jgi:hypothetical protein